MSRFAKKAQSQPAVMPIQNQAVEFAYLSLQRTQRGLMGMLVACAVFGMTVFRTPPGALSNRVYLPVIFSTSLLVFAYSIRNAMVLPSLEALRRNPRDPKALSLWSRNNLIVLCLCGAVGLMGFATQLLSAAAPISLMIYAIAIAYLFLLRPAKP